MRASSLLDQSHLPALPLPVTGCQSAFPFARIRLAEDLHGANSRPLTNLAANLEHPWGRHRGHPDDGSVDRRAGVKQESSGKKEAGGSPRSTEIQGRAWNYDQASRCQGAKVG